MIDIFNYQTSSYTCYTLSHNISKYEKDKFTLSKPENISDIKIISAYICYFDSNSNIQGSYYQYKVNFPKLVSYQNSLEFIEGSTFNYNVSVNYGGTTKNLTMYYKPLKVEVEIKYRIYIGIVGVYRSDLLSTIDSDYVYGFKISVALEESDDNGNTWNSLIGDTKWKLKSILRWYYDVKYYPTNNNVSISQQKFQGTLPVNFTQNDLSQEKYLWDNNTRGQSITINCNLISAEIIYNGSISSNCDIEYNGKSFNVNIYYQQIFSN